MALNMKTACCGVSLRTSTLILLYINLIANVWSMLSAVYNYDNPVYRQFMDDSVVFLVNLAWLLVESLIFLAVIIAIGKEKRINSLLTTVVIFLLLEASCFIYFIMKLNYSETFNNFLRDILEKEIKKFTEFEQNEYGEFTRTTIDMYPIYKTTLNIVFIACLIYKIYSALVIHSYKVELKQKLDTPTKKTANAPPYYLDTDLP